MSILSLSLAALAIAIMAVINVRVFKRGGTHYFVIAFIITIIYLRFTPPAIVHNVWASSGMLLFLCICGWLVGIAGERLWLRLHSTSA